MIGFHDASVMRKSIDRLLEMKHLPFLGLNSQILSKHREK